MSLWAVDFLGKTLCMACGHAGTTLQSSTRRVTTQVQPVHSAQPSYTTTFHQPRTFAGVYPQSTALITINTLYKHFLTPMVKASYNGATFTKVTL